MPKLLIQISLFLILTASSNAFSPDATPPDISLGFKGGLNYFKFSGDNAKMKILFGDEEVSPEYNQGFNAGIFAEYFLGNVRLSSIEFGIYYFQTGADYSQKTAEMTTVIDEGVPKEVLLHSEYNLEYRLNYFSIPVLYNYYLQLTDNLKIGANTGFLFNIFHEGNADGHIREYLDDPDMGELIRNNREINNDLDDENTIKLDLQFAAGIVLRYKLGPGEISLDSRYNYGMTNIFEKKLFDWDEQPDIRNAGFSLSIGYGIFLNEL